MENSVINLSELQKKIENVIKKVYSYGDESGVSPKDIKDKLNDKTQLAELAYSLFSKLVDCQITITSLKSKCIDSKSIVAKLASIEKSVQKTPTIIEAQKHELQQGLKEQSLELQNNMKSYSDVLQESIVTKTSDRKVIDMEKLETVVKKSITDIQAHRDRGCNVMIFGLEPGYEYQDKENVEKMMYAIDVNSDTLVGTERVGIIPTTPGSTDNRPIKAILRDNFAALTMLRAGPKLPAENYDNVYLTRDMTMEERAERRILVKKLKEAIKSHPSRYWIIKSGKIVDAGAKRVKSLPATPVESSDEEEPTITEDKDNLRWLRSSSKN